MVLEKSKCSGVKKSATPAYRICVRRFDFSETNASVVCVIPLVDRTSLERIIPYSSAIETKKSAFSSLPIIP